MSPPQKSNGLTCLGQIVVLLFAAGCLFGAYFLFMRGGWDGPATPGPGSGGATAAPHAAPAGKTAIGIAYGTEKRRWLQEALNRWEQTPHAETIHVELIPMGSVEGGKAIVDGDRRINVWAPASRMYAPLFEADFTGKYGHAPLLSEETLALSPMVFVFWKDRYDAFLTKYPKVDFRTLAEALTVDGGWNTIAAKPDWGLFKLGHTNPNESNSGLMTLILMANSYSDARAPVTMAQVMNPDFAAFLREFQKGVSGLPNSTGNMMKEMVLKGPSVYDCCVVYENVAIDFAKAAAGRWGQVHVTYPEINVWNDNPYYIVDVPWSTPAQRDAAQEFLDFLMSEPIQQLALEHGFRPGNPNVPVLTPASPFTTLKDAGLRQNPGTIVGFPQPEVIANLLMMWNRGR